ncbi:MAG: hypothetical protein R6W90_17655 [Ignavibacteriaceae bacterium]
MKIKYFLVLIMIAVKTILPQSSFGLTGNWQDSDKSRSFLNSFENNPSNFSSLKDWGLSVSYGGEFSSVINSTLYQISLSKRINRSVISTRYTPGYQKDFTFNTGVSIINEDSSLLSLNSKFSYKELFGLGYSYSITDNIAAGFSLRYINQEFVNEEISAVFADSFYLDSRVVTEELNLWKADLGINYNVNKNFTLSAATINLLNFSEGLITEENKKYEMKKPKKGLLGFSYTPSAIFRFHIFYETDNSFMTGTGSTFNIFNGNLSVSASVFHDKYQSPFIAGIQPLISYTSKYFGISLTGIKYFSDRSAAGGTISTFEKDGIAGIINNKYSFDKAILSVSFTLNTMEDKSVEFLDVEILNEIYPALNDNYLYNPFAAGKVVNLTDRPVAVKPESRIKGINNDFIHSPEVTILPFDTSVVFFYTIIPDIYNKEKAEISYADFYISSSGGSPDDQFQTPVLVNGINAWDGKVSSLKNFIRRDLNFSVNYTRNLLSSYKTLLDTLPERLTPFYKTKIIYENIVKQLTYISDPRASAEYVQFPNETIKLKGGDCDDLSVCFNALLKGTGIETAFVDFSGTDELNHVNILVNMELSPSETGIITQNDTKYFIRKNSSGKNEVWIPLETTVLSGFEDAWNAGAEKFNEEALNNYGLVKGTVKIVDVE